MAIFPFIQSLTKDLVIQFGFSEVVAGSLYSVPYLMSAFLCPILGFIIDKFGRRAMWICVSSLLIALSCFLMAALPTYTTGNYICLGPLILVGFGYSIYASALWSSIPYLVKPRTIGSAFGLVTSLQACGLTFSPYIAGLLETKHETNYSSAYVFLGSLATIGFGFNIWLYYDDRKYRKGVLYFVESTVEEMMTSPTIERKSLTERRSLVPTSGDDSIPIAVNIYVTTD